MLLTVEFYSGTENPTSTMPLYNVTSKVWLTVELYSGTENPTIPVCNVTSKVWLTVELYSGTENPTSTIPVFWYQTVLCLYVLRELDQTVHQRLSLPFYWTRVEHTVAAWVFPCSTNCHRHYHHHHHHHHHFPQWQCSTLSLHLQEKSQAPYLQFQCLACSLHSTNSNKF